jgi:hypothetical protein
MLGYLGLEPRVIGLSLLFGESVDRYLGFFVAGHDN